MSPLSFSAARTVALLISKATTRSRALSGRESARLSLGFAD
jgi:hypothetical protein